jgi:predicted metal-dependent peptidase
MTVINTAQLLDSIAEVSFRMLIQEPFYGHFFTGLVRKPNPRIPTLAVSYDKGKNIMILHINPIFWQEDLHSLNYKMGGLKHEILHLVFKHVLRIQDFQHKLIFNVAADLVVNQYILPEQLIEGAILLESFPELALPAHESLDHYYQVLMQLYQQFVDQPNSPEAQQHQSWQVLKRLLDQAHRYQQQHRLWESFEGLSNVERQIVDGLLNEHLKETIDRVRNKNYGNMPKGLSEYLEQFERSLQPSVDWRRILRLFTYSSARTRLRNTLRRPSKRYGTSPGIKIQRKQKILVAIDTSGSIGMEELKLFFAEMAHIWQQGAEICVVECDTEIHQTYFYNGTPPETISGGGGTAFDAPIRYANETYRPDAMVYFTDGYAAIPEQKAVCPMLWLIAPQGADLPEIQGLQGIKIKMNT